MALQHENLTMMRLPLFWEFLKPLIDCRSGQLHVHLSILDAGIAYILSSRNSDNLRLMYVIKFSTVFQDVSPAKPPRKRLLLTPLR